MKCIWCECDVGQNGLMRMHRGNRVWYCDELCEEQYLDFENLRTNEGPIPIRI